VSNVEWFVPGSVLSAVLGLALSARAARALSTRPAIAWLLLFGLGLIISATLTPLREAVGAQSQGVATCDLSRFGLAPIDKLVVVSDESLNVALFVPIGAAIGLLPFSRRAVALFLGSAGLPFVIEGTQLLVTSLRRGCQSADITDNLTGLVLGLVIAVGMQHTSASMRPPTPDSRRDRPSGRS
jgi:hypothetical protein